MTHEEARTYASALADGELDGRLVPALDEHLAGCANCSAFGDRVRDLSSLASALPAEAAPAALLEAVTERLSAAPARTPQLRPAPRRRTSLAFAAVFAVTVVAVLGGLPLPTFRLSAAEATRALRRIESIFIERAVTDHTGPDSPTTTVERIWFKAPGLLRIERRTGGRVEIEIRRPGERYVRNVTGAFRETGLPPEENPVPEPLSPTIALLGNRVGPGPVVAGRATVRIEVQLGGREHRSALVDASRFVVLGSERNAIIQKRTTINGELVETKRTLKIRYNPALPPTLFAIPEVPSVDRGFRAGGLGSLAAPPRAVPAGMTLVRAGAGPLGAAALFADGAFAVLVEVNGPSATSEGTVERQTTVAGRDATLALSLFDIPRVTFVVHGAQVTVVAPLEPDRLLALAASMYPAE